MENNNLVPYPLFCSASDNSIVLIDVLIKQQTASLKLFFKRYFKKLYHKVIFETFSDRSQRDYSVCGNCVTHVVAGGVVVSSQRVEGAELMPTFTQLGRHVARRTANVSANLVTRIS